MATATATFTARDDKGRSHTFRKGDTVPDEVAALVGEHVLDVKPEPEPDLRSELAAAGFDNVDQALVAANEKLQAENAELVATNESLTVLVEELQRFKDKVTSGDLSDLDLDELTRPDGQDGAGDGQPAASGDEPGPEFDPSAHSAAEVLEYLESADEAEDERVRAAEKAGKNRKAILGDS